MKAKSMPVHYGWIIVLTGMLCVFACLGLGRFALGMLLPSMASTLGLTYSQMGLISTAYFVGYLVSVLACGLFINRFGSRHLIFGALLLVGASMILVSKADSFLSVLLLYFLTGVGSGAANVPVMGLVSHWFMPTKRGKAAGYIVIGSGFAIILTGKLIPFINSVAGSEGWRVSWAILGSIALFISVISLLVLRNSPEEKGLRPVGSGDTGRMYDRMRERGTKISRATIYRTLELLYGCGLVGRVRLNEEKYRCERLRKGEHHDHLVCTNCGKVVEFVDGAIDKRQDAVCKEHDFVATSHSHQIWGL